MNVVKQMQMLKKVRREAKPLLEYSLTLANLHLVLKVF
jgi:hypothetical protein